MELADWLMQVLNKNHKEHKGKALLCASNTKEQDTHKFLDWKKTAALFFLWMSFLSFLIILKKMTVLFLEKNGPIFVFKENVSPWHEHIYEDMDTCHPRSVNASAAKMDTAK